MLKLFNNKYATIVLIALFCTSAFIIRVVFPYSSVFTDDGVIYTSVDAYGQMRLVDNLVANFPNITPFDPYFSYPDGNGTGGMHLFVYSLAFMIWIIGLGHPSQELVSTVAAYYPAVLGALTVIPVYFIGKLLFNRIAGLIAAGMTAVFAGEFLGRSLLGFTDDHVLEMLLSTLFMLFVILAFKSAGKKRYVSIGMALIVFVAFILTWQGAFIFAALLFIALITGFLFDRLYNRILDKRLLIVCGGVLLIVVVYFIFNPQVFSAINAFLFTPSAVATQEMRPILYPTGSTFTTVPAWGNFTTSLFFSKYHIIPGLGIIAIFVLSWLFIKNKMKDKTIIFFLIWSIATLFMTLMVRRFSYYLTINLALLTGFLISMVFKWISDKKIINLPFIARAIVITGLLFVAFYWNVTKSVEIAKGNYYNVPQSWNETLQWVKENTPEPLGGDIEYYNMHNFDADFPDSYGVVSWWDYGYWITRIAHRIPVVNPSQNAVMIEKVADMFMSEDEGYIDGAPYIILDSETSTGKLGSVAYWANESLNKYIDIYYIKDGNNYRPVIFYKADYYRTLMVRLYNFNGHSVQGKPDIIIYESRVINEKQIKLIIENRVIDSYAMAEYYVENYAGDGQCVLLGRDPFISPVDIPDIESYKAIYTGNKVKVFEYVFD